jgi:hypothetical protein
VDQWYFKNLLFDIICIHVSINCLLFIVVAELKRNVETPLLMLLIGNKSDLSEQRVVSHDQGYSYATSVGALFSETSAAFQKGDFFNTMHQRSSTTLAICYQITTFSNTY